MGVSLSGENRHHTLCYFQDQKGELMQKQTQDTVNNKRVYWTEVTVKTMRYGVQ